MSKETLVIEAESLEKAREQARFKTPAGFLVRSEQVVSDGKPKKVKAIAETAEAAFVKAQVEVPADAEVTEKKILVTNEQAVVTFPTVEGQNPETVAKSLAQQRMGVEAQIRNLRLVVAGNKGFIGIGKKPNQYEVEIFRQTVVEITYKLKAVIHVNIDDDITAQDIKSWQQNRNVDRLLQTLRHKDTKVREDVASALTDILRDKDTSKADCEAIIQTARQLNIASPSLLEAWKEYQELQNLLDTLYDSQQKLSLRLSACEELCKTADLRVAVPLAMFLTEERIPDFDFRSRLTYRLQNFKDKRILPILLNYLERLSPQDVGVINAVTQVLGNLARELDQPEIARSAVNIRSHKLTQR